MSLGPAEILVVLVLALIVFGPKRLPEVGRQIGGAMRELRKMQTTVETEIRSVLDDTIAPSHTMQPNPTPPLADPPVDAVSRPSSTVPAAIEPPPAAPAEPDLGDEHRTPGPAVARDQSDIDGLSGGTFS
jgi:sec-independent protein translocase protein TatA